MKKNLFKRIVTAVVTTAMAVGMIATVPTEVKAADTTQEVYLVADEDAAYQLCLWGKSYVWADVEEDGTTYAYPMYKDDNGLYKLVLSFSGDNEWNMTGISVKVGSDEYKADPQWSGEEGAASWEVIQSLLNNGQPIYLEMATDADGAYILKTTTAPSTGDDTDDESDDTNEDVNAGDDTDTDADTDADANAGTPDTGDSAMVALYLAVAVAAAVVVLKKKSVTE